MRLDYKRLEAAGFKVVPSKTGLELLLQGPEWPDAVRHAVQVIAEQMSFTGTDEDALINFIGDTYQFGVLKEAIR